MREQVAEGLLKNRRTEEKVRVPIYEGISDKNFDDIENHWRPFIRDRISQSSSLNSFHVEDQKWDWEKKTSNTAGMLLYKQFALEFDEKTQGLMLISLGTRRSKHKEHIGRELVHIEYLASAPWNRSTLMEPDLALYKGVGETLVALAVQVSFGEGFNGLIGLHSLEQAESFYRDRCKMIDMGINLGESNLRYFEMTPEIANAFIGRGG